jgi:hypothetical protein
MQRGNPYVEQQDEESHSLEQILDLSVILSSQISINIRVLYF